MVEYIGIPYSQSDLHAALPAVISYIALYYIVHLEALKLGLRPIPRSGPVRTWLQRLMGVLFGFIVTAAIAVAVVARGIGWLRAVARRLVLVGLLAAPPDRLYRAGRLRGAFSRPRRTDKPVAALPPAGPTFKAGLHFLLPVVVLVWCLMVELLSPGLSAFSPRRS